MRRIRFISLLCLFTTFSTLITAPSLFCAAHQFYGRQLLTRVQLAMALSRILHLRGVIPEDTLMRPGRFTDVPRYYTYAVAGVTSTGVMRGIEEKFGSNKPVTRYRLALCIDRLLKKVHLFTPPVETRSVGVPKDLPRRHWARGAVLRVLWHGIMKPHANRFNGRFHVNRFEFAAVCSRLADALNMKEYADYEPFFDVPDHHWALPFIRHAVETGVLHKCGVTPLACRKEVGQAYTTMEEPLPGKDKTEREDEYDDRVLPDEAYTYRKLYTKNELYPPIH